MVRVVSFKVKMEHWNKRNANKEEMYQIYLVINLMWLWPVVLHSQMQGYILYGAENEEKLIWVYWSYLEHFVKDSPRI